MSFYGNIINYLGSFLELAELVSQDNSGKKGTFLHFRFKINQQESQDIYIDVKSLNEFETITSSNTIDINVVNEVLTASLKNNSVQEAHIANQAVTGEKIKNNVITGQHLSTAITDQLNHISVIDGILTIE